MFKQLILAAACGMFFFSAQAQKDKKLAESTVTRTGFEAKVRFLASDEMRGRQTPSPELNLAARYLATNLMQYGVKTMPGVDTYLQPVRMVSSAPPSGGSLTVGDSLYDFKENMILLSGGGSTEISAEMVYLDYGTETDFAEAEIRGKIVVTRSGRKGESEARAAFAASREKSILAETGGAVALIELFHSPQPNWKILQFYLSSVKVALDNEEDVEEDEPSNFPQIWLEDVSNTKWPTMKAHVGNVQLEVNGSEDKYFETYNVVGMVEGTDPKLKNQYVVYSGHYDHVGVGDTNVEGDSIFNGTRDNAIGSSTILEAAQNIAKYPMKRSAIFIFFTGEEKGLLGSEWYVQHPLMPMDKVVYCFNSDNAGYNDTTIVTIVGLSRTTVAEQLKTACSAFGLTAIDDPVPDQNLFDRSDHVNFARAGVPALMYTLGLTAFDDELLKYYHQQSDNPDSVNYDYLYKFTQAYVYACRLIGNMKETPFWIPGDKYYDAGKALYGM